MYSLLQVKRDGRPGTVRERSVDALDGRGPRRVVGRQSAEELPRNVAVGVRRIRVNYKRYLVPRHRHVHALLTLTTNPYACATETLIITVPYVVYILYRFHCTPLID